MAEEEENEKSWQDMTLNEKTTTICFLAGFVFGFVFVLYLAFSNGADNKGYWTGFTILWVTTVSFCGLGGLSLLYDTVMNKKDNATAPDISLTGVQYTNLRY